MQGLIGCEIVVMVGFPGCGREDRGWHLWNLWRNWIHQGQRALRRSCGHARVRRKFFLSFFCCILSQILALVSMPAAIAETQTISEFRLILRIRVLAGYQLGFILGAFNLPPLLCSDCWAPKNYFSVCIWKTNEACFMWSLFLWSPKVIDTLANIESLSTRCNCVYVQTAGHRSIIVVFVYGRPMKLILIWSCSLKVQGVWYNCENREF